MSRLGDGEIEEVARGSGYPSGQLVGHGLCVGLMGRSSDTGIFERFD
jgi:flagellar basal body P-ring protein FlgI